MNRRNSWFLFFLVTAGVLLIRFWALGEKPIHHDESINGWFVTQMWTLGYFKYDPTNYHGPLLFYLFQWLEPFFGSSIYMMRGLTTLASALTALVFFAEGIFRKRWAFGVAGLAFLLSPGGEFFGRSAIHESLFVLCQLLVLWGIASGWMIAWVGFCGMLLLKETWSVFLLSVMGAIVWSRYWQTDEWNQIKIWIQKNTQRLTKVFLIGLAVVFLIYTGFLQNPRGFLDFFNAFLPWAKTGTGHSGHEKPFMYWLELMSKNEPLTLLFLGLSFYGLFVQSRKIQFFSATAVLHFLIYSFIPYKTPWCILSFQITILWAGSWVLEHLLENSLKAWKKATVAVLMAASLVQIPTLVKLCWISPIDLSHPYVYVQTEYDIKNLMTAISQNESLLFNEKLEIATAENWPFPWLLRNYPQLKFSVPTADPDLKAAIIMFDEVQKSRVDSILAKTHTGKIIQVRQARERAVVYVRNDLLKSMGAF